MNISGEATSCCFSIVQTTKTEDLISFVFCDQRSDNLVKFFALQV